MNVQPNQSNTTPSSASETAEAPHAADDTNQIIDELMRRITPRIMDRLIELINEALSCRCCT